MNDDNAPRHLDKLFNSLGGFAKTVKRTIRKHRQALRGKPKNQPRQICDICGTGFDHAALVVTNLIPQTGRCRDCKQMLFDGYVACITYSGQFVFVRHHNLRDLGGKVLTVSEEQMASIKARYKEQLDESAKTNGKPE